MGTIMADFLRVYESCWGYLVAVEHPNASVLSARCHGSYFQRIQAHEPYPECYLMQDAVVITA